MSTIQFRFTSRKVCLQLSDRAEQAVSSAGVSHTHSVSYTKIDRHLGHTNRAARPRSRAQRLAYLLDAQLHHKHVIQVGGFIDCDKVYQ